MESTQNTTNKISMGNPGVTSSTTSDTKSPKHISRPGKIGNKVDWFGIYRHSNISFLVVFDAAICVYDADGKFVENLTSQQAKFEEATLSYGRYSFVNIITAEQKRTFQFDTSYNPKTGKMDQTGALEVSIITGTALETTKIVEYAKRLTPDASFVPPQFLEVPQYKKVIRQGFNTRAKWALALFLLALPTFLLSPLLAVMLLLTSFFVFLGYAIRSFLNS